MSRAYENMKLVGVDDCLVTFNKAGQQKFSIHNENPFPVDCVIDTSNEERLRVDPKKHQIPAQQPHEFKLICNKVESGQQDVVKIWFIITGNQYMAPTENREPGKKTIVVKYQ